MPPLKNGGPNGVVPPPSGGQRCATRRGGSGRVVGNSYPIRLLQGCPSRHNRERRKERAVTSTAGRLPDYLNSIVAAASTLPQKSLDSGIHRCHSTTVTVLRFQLRPGQSIFDQVVFAATKAFLSGEFQPGQPFPSVRTLAAELKIHPNTAHKVVQYLIQEGWLESRPGIGTVVADPPQARAGERKRILQQEVEQLVVEARRVGLELEEIIAAIESHWVRFEKPLEVSRK